MSKIVIILGGGKIGKLRLGALNLLTYSHSQSGVENHDFTQVAGPQRSCG